MRMPKLVAAEPRRDVRRPQDGPDPPGDLEEDAITGGMAERFIDDLEPVDIEEDHGYRRRPVLV